MIFCVEDDAAIRDLMLYTLNAAGFEAEGFSESTAFWAALAEKTPELIIDIRETEQDVILSVSDTGMLF